MKKRTNVNVVKKLVETDKGVVEVIEPDDKEKPRLSKLKNPVFIVHITPNEIKSEVEYEEA